MPETHTPTVPDAFAALVAALSAAALAQPKDFDRITAYRRRVMDLSERWADNAPPHTPRGPSQKAEG